MNARATVRPRLAALARALVRRHAYGRRGFRALGDYARERLGVGARVVREWARVWEGLSSLPVLRASVISGDVSWSVARKVVALATPDTDATCAASVRHRTVRAVNAMLRALPAESPPAVEAEAEPYVAVTVPLAAEAMPRWLHAIELARRVAGETLPVWACAEAIAAETLAELGDEAAPELDPGMGGGVGGSRCVALDASAHDLDAALRRELAALQRLDADLGALLREILERRLYRELGFERFERYVEERADVAPRTARRWVRLARGDADTRAVAGVFRAGEITGLQAQTVLEASEGDAPAWLAFARSRTLRGLEDATREVGTFDTAIDFSAPESAALVFRAAIAAARRNLEQSAVTPAVAGPASALASMIEHAIAAWEEQGSQFRDYADFDRDGWRCTAPRCTARRNLQSHHVIYRSAGGTDEPSNRTTLCAFHHLRGIHAGVVSCQGRAPAALVFALGVRPGGAALLRARSGDVLLS